MAKHIIVESAEPLEIIQEKDYAAYAVSETKHPLLRETPDRNRTDYFDISYGPDPLNTLDIHHLKGNGKRPVIVFIHGGGWTRRDKDLSRFVAPAWVAAGYTVVSINYRLTKPDSGIKEQRNTHPAQIDDCARALKWIIDNIENYGGDPDEIAVAGHSSGGHLAALLVCDTRWHEKYAVDIRKVKCWISLSGVLDLTLEENYCHEWLAGFITALVDAEYKLADASPVNFVRGTEPPCLLVHGTNDYMVPIKNSLDLYNKLYEKGVSTEICILKHAAHMDYFSRLSEEKQFAANSIKQFLERYLKPSKTVDH